MSSFDRSPEPNAPEALASTANSTVSSRSSQNRLMKGVPVRAVTFQSMRADVVARLVLADLVELHAPAAEHALVLAGKQVVDRPVGDDLDPPHLLENRGDVLLGHGQTG